MKTVVADSRTLDLLSQADEMIEIRDASGKVIGFFTPASMSQVSGIDLEELQRRKLSSEKGASSAEVLARLQTLENESERRKKQGEKALTADEGVAFIQGQRRQG